MEEDEMPEPESLDELSHVFTFGGLPTEEFATPRLRVRWTLSRINPGSAILKLPGLQLKPGWRLVSYLYQDEDDGKGLVLAVPEALATTTQLEKALPSGPLSANTLTHLTQRPKPEGALADCMEAIDGDRSAVSFIVASLLHREFQEFGARGIHRNWGYHRLIDSVPQQVSWRWQTCQPKDLAPKVKVMPDGQAVVEFFSCRVGSGIALYRHFDQYPSTQYLAKRVDKPVAIAQRHRASTQ